MSQGDHPRVLVVAMGRINAADTANNGLLLRNLFGAWPRQNLAQVYSGGDNGDQGRFGHQYRLDAGERRFGRLYYRLKAESPAAAPWTSPAARVPTGAQPARLRLRAWVRRLAVDTGLYEELFPVRLSAALQDFVAAFAPQAILAQGYSLSFARLALLLADHCRVPLVYYPTDDWADSLYHPATSPARLLSWLPRRDTLRCARRLAQQATVRLAFNPYMREEYGRRYDRDFTVLMHGDDSDRFARLAPRRAVADAHPLIVCTGDFDIYRWDLLADMNRACDLLAEWGLKPCIAVFPVNYSPALVAQAAAFRWVRLAPCPAHDELVAFLRGADLLFLAERFGGDVWQIRLSVSSKAHLFMYAQRPALVYSDPAAGVLRYAREGGWAATVDRRDPQELARAVRQLVEDPAVGEAFVRRARETAAANHDLHAIQRRFLALTRHACEPAAGGHE